MNKHFSPTMAQDILDRLQYWREVLRKLKLQQLKGAKLEEMKQVEATVVLLEVLALDTSVQRHIQKVQKFAQLWRDEWNKLCREERMVISNVPFNPEEISGATVIAHIFSDRVRKLAAEKGLL
jgi:hypothetical protein